MKLRLIFLGLPAVLGVEMAYGPALAEPITRMEHNDPERWAGCERFEDARERRECFYRDTETNWSIEIYESGGIPGTPGADLVVPNAFQVLQGIVDRCELGSAYFLRATDGVAHLYVGHPDLTPKQIDCIRSAERPGLWLREEKN